MRLSNPVLDDYVKSVRGNVIQPSIYKEGLEGGKTEGKD